MLCSSYKSIISIRLYKHRRVQKLFRDGLASVAFRTTICNLSRVWRYSARPRTRVDAHLAPLQTYMLVLIYNI